MGKEKNIQITLTPGQIRRLRDANDYAVEQIDGQDDDCAKRWQKIRGAIAPVLRQAGEPRRRERPRG